MLIEIMAVLTAMQPAVPAPYNGSIAGIWSLGERRDCAAGQAWVFLSDGYYVEVSLPDQGPFAVGTWKDEGATIAYTHSHMPFADAAKPGQLRRFTVERRTADRLDLRTYRGDMRIFHRCPEGSLKAPSGQRGH
jgi:hypothetical protein